MELSTLSTGYRSTPHSERSQASMTQKGDGYQECQAHLNKQSTSKSRSTISVRQSVGCLEVMMR
eukprot:2635848-Amphidinium_carterae.1